MSTLGAHTCYGAVPTSTVTTILMTVLQDQLPPADQLMAVDHDSLVRAVVRAVASQLLQLVKPHVFLQQMHGGVQLPEPYVDFYLHKQEHYNLKQLLSALGAGVLPEIHPEVVETLPDQPECSSAVSCEDQRVLLSRQTPQKWVLFTCTTPDLDMGYILPAGTVAASMSQCCCNTSQSLTTLGLYKHTSFVLQGGTSAQACCFCMIQCAVLHGLCDQHCGILLTNWLCHELDKVSATSMVLSALNVALQELMS